MKKRKGSIGLARAGRKATELYGPLPTLEQLEKGFPVEIERLIYAKIGAFVEGYRYAKGQRRTK